MEVSDVRKKVLDAIEHAKKSSAARRARAAEASRAYETFLEHMAVPLFRQVASVLRAHGFQFTVFTPGGSVRLMSDRAAEDYIELALDTTGPAPAVVGHSSRIRGRRVVESEHPIAEGRAVEDLTEDDILAYVLKEITPFVER
jgi:hypothetical protein